MELPLTATQYPGEKKQQATIVMGIDYGTSSTKVVIQSPTLGYSHAIPFDDYGHSSNVYLLPTRPYYDKSGEIKLDGLTQGSPLRELKRKLMHPDAIQFEFNEILEIEANSTQLTIGYLAKVIQIARHWFLVNNYEIYSTYNLEWYVNIGMPSTDNEYFIKKDFFKQIISKSWILSTSKENISIEEVSKLEEIMIDNHYYIIDCSYDNFSAIPEIVSETIGYARSNLRKDGLHILIDVGAGTLDISCFKLYEEDGVPKYYILLGKVAWLGGFELHKSRLEVIRPKINKWLTELGMKEDPVSSIPSNIEGYMPKPKDIDCNDELFDSNHFEKCFQFIQEQIIELRKNRDPNAPEMKEGIRTFMSGGGISIEFYNKVINEINLTWKKLKLSGLNIFNFEKPDKLIPTSLTDSEFNRIAVAYGLSYQEFDFGDIKPSEQIDDVPKPEPPEDFTQYYISGDQV